MEIARQNWSEIDTGAPDGVPLRIKLFFFLGVPTLTAMLFGLNQAGMARLLPSIWDIPYWLGLTIPLWIVLDAASRLVDWTFGALKPHRWLVLFGGALLTMAVFSLFVPIYVDVFRGLLPEGASYTVQPAFPEAFLDLRRFVAYAGVPIYWIVIALFFARNFGFPRYLVLARDSAGDPPLSTPAPRPEAPWSVPEQEVQLEPEFNDYGLPVRQGFRALVPYHLGNDLISLSSEDHYVRVVTDCGNAMIRYRFADALGEVRGLPGIQVHRSHWVAVRAVARVGVTGKAYRLVLHNGTEVPVSRSNIGVLRAAGLL